MASARNITGALVALAVAAAALGGAPGPLAVKYLSAEHVYLDGGRADGLAVGDTLKVVREGRELARLVVVFAADHSASCTTFAVAEPPAVGDAVVLVATGAGREAATAADAGSTAGLGTGAATGDRAAAPDAADTPPGAPRRTHGRVALRWMLWNATGPDVGAVSEPSLRARLAVPDALARDLDLEIDGTVRHITRDHGLGDLAPDSEWRNRIYRAALVYRPDAAAFGGEAGRVYPRSVAGVGWLDGLLGEARLGGHAWLGGFAGWEPGWQNSGVSTDVTKAGIFAHHRSGRPGAGYATASLAAVGLYRDGDVSREYLHLGARWDVRRDLGLQTSWELDLNRGWRRDRAGESVSLSGVYAGLRWQPAATVGVNASYDGRQQPWTALNRSRPDSLYQDAMRQGVRLRGRIRVDRHLAVTVLGGWRRNPAYGDDTWSYGLGVTRDGLAVDLGGYDGPLARGWRGAVTARRAVGRGHLAHLGGGVHGYEAPGGPDTRTAAWAGGGVDLAVARRTVLAVDYRYEWGDDTGGHRLLAEIGRRF